MKIRVIETEIEASAEELKASQTLAQNFAAALSSCFTRVYRNEDAEDESEDPE